MRRLLFIAFVLVPSLAAAAPREVASPRQPMPEASLQAVATQMIDLRARSLGLYAPLPTADAMTAELVIAKLAALSSARAYNIQILEGLVASAATDDDQHGIADQLTPALARFDNFAGHILMQILDSPVAAPHGWIVPSTFGQAAERQAAELLITLGDERAFLAALGTKIGTLADGGLASVESKRAVDAILDRRTAAQDQAGLSLQ
jgi:hypothetical protein